MTNNEQITIRGIVTPADWDEEGNITAVVISTPREEEYLVQGEELREELLGLIGAEVVARGTLGVDEQGYKTIAVKRYELLDEEQNKGSQEDEEEYSDDWEFKEETEFEDEEELEYQQGLWQE